MQRAYNGTTPCNGNNASTMNNAYNENKAPVVVNVTLHKHWM